MLYIFYFMYFFTAASIILVYSRFEPERKRKRRDIFVPFLINFMYINCMKEKSHESLIRPKLPHWFPKKQQFWSVISQKFNFHILNLICALPDVRPHYINIIWMSDAGFCASGTSDVEVDGRLPSRNALKSLFNSQVWL